MNAERLCFKDGRETNVWMCGNCGLLYSETHFGVVNTKVTADRCCNWKCEVCGVDVSVLTNTRK